MVAATEPRTGRIGCLLGAMWAAGLVIIGAITLQVAADGIGSTWQCADSLNPDSAACRSHGSAWPGVVIVALLVAMIVATVVIVVRHRRRQREPAEGT